MLTILSSEYIPYIFEKHAVLMMIQPSLALELSAGPGSVCTGGLLLCSICAWLLQAHGTWHTKRLICVAVSVSLRGALRFRLGLGEQTTHTNTPTQMAVNCCVPKKTAPLRPPLSSSLSSYLACAGVANANSPLPRSSLYMLYIHSVVILKHASTNKTPHTNSLPHICIFGMCMHLSLNIFLFVLVSSRATACTLRPDISLSLYVSKRLSYESDKQIIRQMRCASAIGGIISNTTTVNVDDDNNNRPRPDQFVHLQFHFDPDTTQRAPHNTHATINWL